MYSDLRLEDLRVGMTVRDYQLNSIYNVCILLSNTKKEKDNKEGIDCIIGTIEFIGDSSSKKYSEILDIHREKDGCRNMLMIYNQPTGVYLA